MGPIIATRLGIRTVDVGLPQLSMHSAREMCGVEDVLHGVNFFTRYFAHFHAVEESLQSGE